MYDRDECYKALLYPYVKSIISLAARVAQVSLITAFALSAIGAILHLGLLLFTEQIALSFAIRLNTAFIAQLLTLLFCACIGILLPWCHHLLLLNRGVQFTRAMSLFTPLLSVFLIISQLYFAFSGARILPNQDGAPFLITIIMGISITCNWDRMAVLSVPRRIALNLICPLLLICLALGVLLDPIYSSLMRLFILLIIYTPLRWLRQHAKLIVALPPLSKEELRD